ncbi:MAG TPA: MarR family transcriptional regulator [Iamia sp.]
MTGGEVPWLDPHERQVWLRFVRAASAVLADLDHQLQRDAGIVHSHFLILSTISIEPDDEIGISALAAALRYSPSRLSHALRRLEHDGWVARRPDPDDGRAQRVRLTAEGQARIETIAPKHVVEVRQRVFDQLTAAQVDELAAISDALLTGSDDAT